MKNLTIEDLPYFPDSCRVFTCIKKLPFAVFLDSAKPYSVNGRYDIISADPKEIITEYSTSYSDNLTYFDKLKGALDKLSCDVKNPLQLPFCGGLIGYLSYDLGKQTEQLPTLAIDDCKSPVAIMGLYTWAIIVDHQEKKTYLVGHPQAEKKLLSRVRQLLESVNPTTHIKKGEFTLSSPFSPTITKQSYANAFDTIKDYIHSGDCYQINLAQRFTAEYQGDSWHAYQALRKVTCAPFSAFLDFGKASILSLSPERFIQVKQRNASTQPIKGTRKRSSDPHEDNLLAKQLLNSPKDQAENLMIVDLLRNDLGKCCEPGSIKVETLFELQSFETVHHLVSTINGTLKSDVTPLALLKACFPGGSITGAPKKRAMEIIEELESHRRSAYCGAIGYIGCDGQMDTNIAIRTLLLSEGRAVCWAGGGIVADSECEEEYQECFSKVEKIMSTLEGI